MTKLNTALIKQAITSRLSNKRQSTSHAKTRSEVSGGGRKPWRQKGTGRARAGSTRSPIWSGGGVTFGPSRERNHSKHLPKKMSKKALAELINHLSEEKKITVVESLSLKEAKTKAALAMLAKHDLTNQRVSLITNSIEPELVLATRNLKMVKVVCLSDLSILDIASGRVVVDAKVAEALNIKKPTPAKTEPKKAPAKKATTKKTVKKEDK